MLRKTMLVYMAILLVISPLNHVFANTAVLPTTKSAELFGPPLSNLRSSALANHLNSMGLKSYPTYREEIVNYSLGPDGILGITNAAIYTNASGFVQQALLTGVIQSNDQRRAIGDVFLKKYGEPSEGILNRGIGRSKWSFEDGTEIDFRNTTYDVSILYVNSRPKSNVRSGRIDVEALYRKSR